MNMMLNFLTNLNKNLTVQILSAIGFIIFWPMFLLPPLFYTGKISSTTLTIFSAVSYFLGFIHVIRAIHIVERYRDKKREENEE
jgi:hypothetical protein